MKLATLIIISSITLVGLSLVIPSYIAYSSFTNEFEEIVTSDLKILTHNAMDKIDRMMNERVIDIKFLTSKSNLNLVGSQNSIKEKMDYLREFEAQEFQKTNPDESIRIMADAENVPLESMLLGLEAVFMTDLDENIKVMDPANDASLKNAIDEISKFYMERGQISYQPTFYDIIEPKFVKELSEQ